MATSPPHPHQQHNSKGFRHDVIIVNCETCTISVCHKNRQAWYRDEWGCNSVCKETFVSISTTIMALRAVKITITCHNEPDPGQYRPNPASILAILAWFRYVYYDGRTICELVNETGDAFLALWAMIPCVLLCCGYVLVLVRFLWFIYLYHSGLLHRHWDNPLIVPVPVKQP